MRNALKLMGFIALTALVGCGDDIYHNPEKIVEKEVFVAQDFEGLYDCEIVSAGICDVASPPLNCSTQSYLELYADYADRVSFETSGQSLNSINPQNGTLGSHPAIGDRDLQVVGNQLLLAPRNNNYSSSTHDIEEDANGANITGNRRTDTVVTLKNNGNLKLEIKIFDGAVNSNINNAVASREFLCKRVN